MSKRDDDFWDEVVVPLRRKMGFTIPTPEEAEKELREAPDDPLPPERVEEIMEYVRTRLRQDNVMKAEDPDLGPLPKIHPREKVLIQATQELRDYIDSLSDRHDLTSTELNYTIVGYLRGFSQRLIAIERRQAENP